MSQAIIEKLLEVIIGIVTVVGLKIKLSDRNNVSPKDLMKQLEEKSKIIERLTIEKHTWQMRHDHLKKTKNLHSS